MGTAVHSKQSPAVQHTAVQQSPAAQSGEVWDTGTMHGSPLSPRPVSGIEVTRGDAAVTLSRVTCHDTRQHCQHQAESCDYYLGDWWHPSGLTTDPHITFISIETVIQPLFSAGAWWESLPNFLISSEGSQKCEASS